MFGLVILLKYSNDNSD